MRKPLILSTLLATALVCSSLAFAATPPPATSTGPATAASQSWHHGMRQHRMHRRHHAMGIFGRLKLTDAQRSKVHELARQNFDRARPEMHRLQQQRMAFENATPGSAPYRSAAQGLAQAESNAAHARVLRQADLRAKIYELLTPTQRTQLASIRSQREAKMKQWRESHMRKQSAGTPAASSASAH
ncbi:MAG: Spy/CpxP family protein refolding chaperone [Rhodanobacteraceae bacterium]